MAISTPLPQSTPRGFDSIWTTIYFATGLSLDVEEPPAVVDDALMSAAADFRSARLTSREDGAEVRVVPAAVAYLRATSRRFLRDQRAARAFD